MPEFGLIGKNISYSFSKDYFNNKFKEENIPYSYVNFDIEEISEIKDILSKHPELIGVNVTIPYKEEVIPLLTDIDKTAKKIGAVNTIKINRKGELFGYNTDAYGFRKSIKPYLKKRHKSALILGTGGASKAISFSLKKLKIQYDFVTRNNLDKAKFLYSDLTDDIISSYSIIINCTPIGTYPNVNDCPDIPFEGIGEDHILYDLVYNPPLSKFLICGELKGATIINGADMLKHQADKAWELWNSL